MWWHCCAVHYAKFKTYSVYSRILAATDVLLFSEFYTTINVQCLKNTRHSTFGHDFGKCRPISFSF